MAFCASLWPTNSMILPPLGRHSLIICRPLRRRLRCPCRCSRRVCCRPRRCRSRSTASWPAILFRKSVWLSGSIGLTAMPSTPLATRSFRICCCSAALPLRGMRKSTSTSPSSLAAASQPARANVQKFAALLLTNASFLIVADAGLFPVCGPEEFWFFPQPERIAAAHKTINRGWFFFIGMIVEVFIWWKIYKRSRCLSLVEFQDGAWKDFLS